MIGVVAIHLGAFENLWLVQQTVVMISPTVMLDNYSLIIDMSRRIHHQLTCRTMRLAHICKKPRSAQLYSYGGRFAASWLHDSAEPQEKIDCNALATWWCIEGVSKHWGKFENPTTFSAKSTFEVPKLTKSNESCLEYTQYKQRHTHF